MANSHISGTVLTSGQGYRQERFDKECVGYGYAGA